MDQIVSQKSKMILLTFIAKYSNAKLMEYFLLRTTLIKNRGFKRTFLHLLNTNPEIPYH